MEVAFDFRLWQDKLPSPLLWLRKSLIFVHHENTDFVHSLARRSLLPASKLSKPDRKVKDCPLFVAACDRSYGEGF